MLYTSIWTHADFFLCNGFGERVGILQNVHACAGYVTRYASEAAAGSMTKLALHGKPYRFSPKTLLLQPIALKQLLWQYVPQHHMRLLMASVVA